jgi:ketosteroid isomerase-like protein
MSQENLEIVQNAWDAFSRGDVEAAFEVFAADVEWDVSRDIWGAVVGGGHYRGVEGVASWLTDLYDAWETFEMEAEEQLDAGEDQVITVLSARGRGRASGIEVEHHPAGVGTLREGKIVRVVWFATRQEALEAAGLSE